MENNLKQLEELENKIKEYECSVNGLQNDLIKAKNEYQYIENLITEHNNQIKELSKQRDNLNSAIKQEEENKLRVEEGDQYYAIDVHNGGLTIRKSTDDRLGISNVSYLSNNYFKTEERVLSIKDQFNFFLMT